ncbi:MAG: LysR substrate-binding domain-containing protein [Xanthobacteraceae bacterium]|jgi:LysR family transcriptional regulator for bpeEF and oprC
MEDAIDRLHGILVFINVVETRNYSATARSLGVSTSAVSAAVLRLEQKLAVRLLNRTTRRVFPTPEGFEFYQRCKRIIADLEQAETAVGRSGRLPSGRIRIGMPSALGRLWVIPRLPDFVRSYPSVSLEIVIGDFFTAQSRDGLDAAIQVGELPSSRMIVRKLAAVDYVVCGAPNYLLERGNPQSPSDLKDHVCLSYRRPRNGQIRQWRFKRGKTVETLTPGSEIIFNSGEALISAASAGLGLAQVAEYYARPEIEAGHMVELMRGYNPHAHDISIIFQQRRRIAPRLRVFVDFLVAMFDPPPWRHAISDVD